MGIYKTNFSIEDALPLAIQFVPKSELEQAFRDPKKYRELSQEIFDFAEDLFVDFNTHFRGEEE
ncbi:MAG: hypothetical protein SOS93_02040 [Mannheimia varigena]|nr:hypothetical protein [Mannheimia varigena]